MTNSTDLPTLDDFVITQARVLSMQMCVVKTATDEEILKAAERLNPCGTQNGWYIVQPDDSFFTGPGVGERVECELHPGRVHLILGC